MSRQVQRRRISPRTVKRYRAIKNFVRRTLGSPSRQDNKSNSSISVSVLDLKQKIEGIEQQLNTVSKHYQDLNIVESILNLKNSLDTEKNHDIGSKKNEVIESNDLYRQDRYSKSISKIIIRDDDDESKLTDSIKMLDQNYSCRSHGNGNSKLFERFDPIEENEQILRKRKNHRVSRNLPSHSALGSCHALTEPRVYTNHVNASFSEIPHQKIRKKLLTEVHNHKEQRRGEIKNKCFNPELDQDFIADIIRRQYRPVKLFGRKESDFSQFSAPVCRDQEFSVKDTVQEGIDLCSCCHEEHRRHRHSKYMCTNDLSEMRSICDTRLYSSRKRKQNTSHRNRGTDYYNDATMYDVIPVKEKPSPKSRRKFVESNKLMLDKYREVPPSPRTHRPQLILRAQVHADHNDNGILEKQFRDMNKSKLKSITQQVGNNSNMSSEVFIHNSVIKGIQKSQTSNNVNPYNEECIEKTCNLQYQMHQPSIINNDTTLNTQTTDVSGDKTDKTLSEIKDILQSFLEELKKESSQSEKLNNSPQLDTIQNKNETQQQIKSNSYSDNNHCGHCGVPPYIQSFPNSCCYPILPICPINCMQNGFVLSSPSFTCAACANNSKEQADGNNDINKKAYISEDSKSETQKLIKEIHNLISHNTNSVQKKEVRNENILTSLNKNKEEKALTSRSVGGSSKASKHDVKVGTTKPKYHSKSCEAIGSREGTRYTTNAIYSDTVLERGSVEEITTELPSESDYSSESVVVNKKRENKLTKILRRIGVLKRNKTDGNEEISESDSTMDIGKPNQQNSFRSPATSPFQQHIMNYNMYGQEYYHPPMTPHHLHQTEFCGHLPQNNCRICYSPQFLDSKSKGSPRKCFNQQDLQNHRTSPHHIPIPTYPNYYDPHFVSATPQPPVCFKEIEVKSIGTQSIRKLSLLQKLTNKLQVPAQTAQAVKETSPKQNSIPTASKYMNLKDKPGATLFDWKKIHEKAMLKTTDPLKFTYKTQKQLAEGDNTMRNAMLKKLFYKRNPFSPRNLLVKTLLGRDRSSFGEPPKMYKPKMFL